MGHCGSFREMWVSVGQEAIVVRKVGSVGLLVNCGSVWVSVGQEGVVVRKVGSVGLLVNCGSLWVIVGQEGRCKKISYCGSFSELWVIVGYCGSLWVVWVF